MSDLIVFTFAGAWGLPSTGPFALKLIKWLELAGLPYRQEIENNPGKGPKGKNPWVELDGERIGDSEIIIALLAERSGFDIDAGLDDEARARGHAARRMLEEHFHMVLEWELFVHPEGASYIAAEIGAAAPPVIAGVMTAMFRRHFRRQLFSRGLGRHSDEVIAAKGIADMEALESLLGDRPFIGGGRPSMADVSAYGLVAPIAKWPMHTPVGDHIKQRPTLLRFIDRMHEARAGTAVAAGAVRPDHVSV
ncbi:MAG TPA: glutathione S-transferase family protein [Devosiaceae bacterium]|jgi:glutathione S-transferase|nr:glutathione S-transferase family protein [Devosiaceae bacterium]